MDCTHTNAKYLVDDDITTIIDALSNKRRYSSKSWKFKLKCILKKEDGFMKKKLKKWKQDFTTNEEIFIRKKYTRTKF
jgi:hypothetical protein